MPEEHPLGGSEVGWARHLSSRNHGVLNFRLLGFLRTLCACDAVER